MAVLLHLREEAFDAISAHLFQDESEHAAFLFIKSQVSELNWNIEVVRYYLVPNSEVTHGTDSYYLELTDVAKAKVIKMASESKTSLGEIHSHPFSPSRCCFSPSDLAGLREFVPHVWWRLRGGPYVAIVMGKSSLDGLVWKTDPRRPVSLDAVVLDGVSRIRPTGLTLKNLMATRRGTDG